MACEFCGEKNKSRLGMRSKVVNGKVETVEICSSCLGKILMHDKSKNGQLLSKGKQFERETSKNKWRLYSELGKNTDRFVYFTFKIRNEIPDAVWQSIKGKMVPICSS